MELKKELIGSRVFISEMRNDYIVNEKNKELFKHFGHFNLFESESTNKKRPTEPVVINAPGTKRSGKGKKVSVPVLKRPGQSTDPEKDSGNLQQ